MKCSFFIPMHPMSGNVRQRMHYHALAKKDKKDKSVMAAIMNTQVGPQHTVGSPHPKRVVKIEVLKTGNELDKDNLIAGLKPFIDVLKVQGRKLGHLVAHEGLVYDDSPKYMDLVVVQTKVDHPLDEGMLFTITEGEK